MRQYYLIPLTFFSFGILLSAQESFSFGATASMHESQVILQEAQNLLAAKEYAASNDILEEFTDKFSNRKYDLSNAYFMMSNNFMHLKELDGAYWANEQSLNLRDEIQADEDIITNFVRFGEIAILKGNYEEALDFLMSATDLPFVDPEIYAKTNYNIAQILHLLGRHFEAEDYYHITAQILSIEFGEDYDKLGPVYLQQTRLALAMNSYDQALYYSSKAKPLLLNFSLPIEELMKPLKQTIADLSIGRYDTKTASEVLQRLMFDAIKMVRL